MSDEPKKRSRAWIAWTLVAFFVLYPLSMGPVFWLCTKTSSDLVRIPLGLACMPIVWVCEQSPALKSAMRSYVEWWLR